MNKTPRLLDLYRAIENNSLSLEEDEMHSFHTLDERTDEKKQYLISSKDLLAHYNAFIEDSPQDLIYFV